MKKHLEHYGYFTGLQSYFNIFRLEFLEFTNLLLCLKGRNMTIARFGYETKREAKNEDSDDSDDESDNESENSNPSNPKSIKKKRLLLMFEMIV
jgi:hypothetical protein